MKSVIVLLAVILVVHADINIFAKREAARLKLMKQLLPQQNILQANKHKRVMQRVREARSVGSIIGYIDRGLNGCRNLSSTVSAFCGITYQSPAMVVRKIDPIIESLADSLIDNSTTDNCRNTIKEFLCKGFYPKCSGDGSTATYQTFWTACQNIYSCNNGPVDTIDLSSKTLCSNSGKTINLKTCIKFNVNTPAVQHTPCYPLPANITFPVLSIGDVARDRLVAFFLQSYLTPSGAFSCYSKWYSFLCANAPYCSPDRSTLLSGATKQQCESVFDCMPENYKPIFARIYDCSAYPDEGSPTMCVGRSQGYGKIIPINSTLTCGQTPTTVAATTVASTTAANTTMATNRASTLPIGSALFYLLCMLLAGFH